MLLFLSFSSFLVVPVIMLVPLIPIISVELSVNPEGTEISNLCKEDEEVCLLDGGCGDENVTVLDTGWFSESKPEATPPQYLQLSSSCCFCRFGNDDGVD